MKGGRWLILLLSLLTLGLSPGEVKSQSEIPIPLPFLTCLRLQGSPQGILAGDFAEDSTAKKLAFQIATIAWINDHPLSGRLLEVVPHERVEMTWVEVYDHNRTPCTVETQP